MKRFKDFSAAPLHRNGTPFKFNLVLVSFDIEQVKEILEKSEDFVREMRNMSQIE